MILLDIFLIFMSVHVTYEYIVVSWKKPHWQKSNIPINNWMFHNNTDHISYLQSVKDLATRREVNFNQYFDNICTMHYIDHVEISHLLSTVGLR